MALERTTASIRIFGERLDPTEITTLLGTEPSAAYRKGEPFSATQGSRLRPKSSWHLYIADAEPGDLDTQILKLLSRTTDDPLIWRDINARFRADVFVGLFMGTTNDMLALEPATLAAASRRGLAIVFDVYSPCPEDEDQA